MSGSIRLFIQEPLSARAVIAVSPGQGHYLATVMRRGVGDPVALFNGRDGEWSARIASVRRDRVSLEVEARSRLQTPESGPLLAFALLKRDPTDLVVRQATELGVSAIVPLITERTNAERTNPARLAAIAAEAAEQCARLTVPELHPARRLTDFLADWPAGRSLFVAIERQAGRFPFPPSAQGREVGLLIGPEGGFSRRELDALQSRPFVVPITLGARVLRAETAAIAGLALLQAPQAGGVVQLTTPD